MKRAISKGIVWRIVLVLFCLVLISSAYFSIIAAKFVSSDDSSVYGRVAEFHGGEVTMGSFYPERNLVATSDIQYYVFEAEFTVTFEACEVDRVYSLSIYIDREYSGDTTLVCPDNAPYADTDPQFKTFNNETDTFDAVSLSSFIDQFADGASSGDFTVGSVYYSKELGDGSKKWFRGDNSEIALITDHSIGKGETVHTFSVLFFLPVISDTPGEQKNDDVYIKYDLDCKQVS